VTDIYDLSMPSAAGVVTGNSYDKYSTEHRAEQRLMSGFMRAFDSMLDVVVQQHEPPSTIIEVGAGEGRIARHLATQFPTATVICVDLYDHDLIDQWRTNSLTGLAADAARLPFPDRAADLVVSLEVLEHVPAPSEALAELARICRGSVVISVPREPIWRVGNMLRGRYLRDLGNTPGHVNHWSSRAFHRLAEPHLSDIEVAHPLPWTMLCGHPR
jgi:ubiquinone/menaquinone biosynthesis C-methylase UbiE